jgi:hypothetical protein
MTALAVAEGAAQRADLNPQIRFLDERLRPSPSYQFLFADYLAAAFDQSSQDVEGAAAEPHRPVVLEQETLLCKELERAKRDRVSIHGIPRRIYPFLYVTAHLRMGAESHDQISFDRLALAALALVL